MPIFPVICCVSPSLCTQVDGSPTEAFWFAGQMSAIGVLEQFVVIGNNQSCIESAVSALRCSKELGGMESFVRRLVGRGLVDVDQVLAAISFVGWDEPMLTQLLRLLHELGADFTRAPSQGNYLIEAARNGSLDAVRFLASELGLNVNTVGVADLRWNPTYVGGYPLAENTPPPLDVPERYLPATPVCAAVAKEQWDVVEFLLVEMKANPNPQELTAAPGPLSIAIVSDQFEGARRLWGWGARMLPVEEGE